MHVHILGRHVYRNLCTTSGMTILQPCDDPNQPAVLDTLEEILAVLGSTALHLNVPIARFDDILPQLQGRRALISFSAQDRDEALRGMEKMDRYLPLER